MPSKLYLVNDFLLLHHVDICCIQESNLILVDNSIWRSIGGARLDHYSYTHSLGSAGGIIITWNSSLYEGHMIHQGIFYLSIKLKFKASGARWICTSVYGPNAQHLKSMLWEEIRSWQPGIGISWVICGDFNSIFSPWDKLIVFPNMEDIRMAQLLVNDLNLIEPPPFGKRIT